MCKSSKQFHEIKLQLGSHDVPRVSAKMDDKYLAAMNMLQLTLPGTPVTYYGEELGLKPIKVPFEKTKDLYARNMGKVRQIT